MKKIELIMLLKNSSDRMNRAIVMELPPPKGWWIKELKHHVRMAVELLLKIKFERKKKKEADVPAVSIGFKRDTTALITNLTGVAGTVEEAIFLVDTEVAKGDCVPIPKEHRDRLISNLFLVKQQSRMEAK